MSFKKNGLFDNLRSDLLSSSVVFLVALPLCLGIALASGASPLSGLIAGIIGGIVVGSISSSPLSVSGPAAGLIVIVLAAIEDLGSFNGFLVAIFLAGLLQIGFGLLKAGKVSNYFPSSVIKGMLAAIGLTLIRKQIPHLVGFDADAFGEMVSFRTDTNYFEAALVHITEGAVIIGSISFTILIFWDSFITKRIPWLKQLPGSFVAVIVAIIINVILQNVAPEFAVFNEHLVSVPRMKDGDSFFQQLAFPDFSILSNPDVYIIAGTLAIVASLESLLSAEAIERLDPENRKSESNRELIAQGVGNTMSGLLGGLPITAVIVRSSANLNAGAKSKLSAILHGALLLVAVLLIPGVLNMIPLSALAAVLIIVGYKLTKPLLFKEQYKLGMKQFLPFIITIIAIFRTDLLIGIGVGLAVGFIFILIENHKVPFFYTEKSAGATGKKKKVVITLSEHVSFLNKASLQSTLDKLPDGVEAVIDASGTKSIDLDVLETIYQFSNEAPLRNIHPVLVGMPPLPGNADHHIDLKEELEMSSELITPVQVLDDLMKGNARFVAGLRKERNFLEEVKAHAGGQQPQVAILSCIDSRAPVEIIFDKGIGDIFTIRVAGNIVNEDVLGSMEFACGVKGSKILMVLGHTACGAVDGACSHVKLGNLTTLLDKISPAIEEYMRDYSMEENMVDTVARINVQLMLNTIRQQSPILRDLEAEGKVLLVGAMYDIETGQVTISQDVKKPVVV